MVAFAPIVQADLSGTAFGSAPTWTDITRYVRLGPSPISITKWRQDQLSDVAPSTMTLVLDNADLPGDATAPNAGRFTPFLTTSPWSPRILPGVRIRAGVTLTLVPTSNLITNPSFESGAIGPFFTTASSAPTATVVTAPSPADSGSRSARVAWVTGSNAGSAGFTYTLAATSGVQYTFSAWLYVPSGATLPQLHAYGPGVGASNFSVAAVATFDAWQRVAVTFTATATGAVQLQLDPSANAVAGSVCYYDAVQVEISAAATDYCDGSQPACSWDVSGNLANTNNFEDGTLNGWVTGANWTAANSAVQAHDGTRSMLTTRANVTAGNGYAASPEFAVTAGLTYTASIWGNASAATGYSIVISWRNAAHVELSRSTLSFTATVGWTRYAVTGAAPVGAAFAAFLVTDDPNGAPTSGSTMYIDSPQLEQRAYATPYGSTGVPNTTTSTRPSSFTFWRFDGYVDTWDAGYENGEFGICTVSASDILARLGAMDPLRAPYVEEVLADTPQALYPLTEGNTSTAAVDISTQAAPRLMVQNYGGAGDATFAGATGIATDSTSTLSLNKTLSNAAADDFNGDYLESQTALAGATSNVTLEAWVSLDPNLATALSRNTASVVYVVQLLQPGVSNFAALLLGYNAGGVYLYDPVAGTTAGPNLNDGGLHHLAFVNNSTGATRQLYVDGVQVRTAATAVTPAASPRVHVGGQDPGIEGFVPATIVKYRGGIGYVAVYPSALTSTRIAAHYTAGKTAFAGEGTSAHIARLLTYRKNLGSTLDAGQGTVSAHAFIGNSDQQALLDTAKAEGGLLYADGTGKVVLLDRTHLRNPVSVLTLDITAQQTTMDLNVRADRDLLLNDVTISRPSGASQRAINQASKDTYGTKGLSETRIIGTDVDAANAAGWLVANGKDVRARTPALSVDLLTEPLTAVAAGVLGLAPLQRVTLSNPPTSMAAADVIVQGCTDTIGVDVFQCAFFVSPMPRPTLRFDAAADSFTKLDVGNVFAW